MVRLRSWIAFGMGGLSGAAVAAASYEEWSFDRVVSRAGGRVAAVELPGLLREPVLSGVAWAIGADVAEAERPLNEYASVGEFLARRLRAGARPIDATAGMVSPVDGTIVAMGSLGPGGVIESVKGRTYALHDLLGESALADLSNTAHLHHVVLMLAPGDYQGYHAPAPWHVQASRHFPGALTPFGPAKARWAVDRLAKNERVALLGQWAHGFFSMTTVGALGFGSMQMDFDRELRTNLREQSARSLHAKAEAFFPRDYHPIVHLAAGEPMGRFLAGSCVVLVFEAPSVSWNHRPGDRIRMGESLLHLN